MNRVYAGAIFKFTFLFFMGFPMLSYSQTDTVIQRFFFIGDAGELKNNRQTVLDWLIQNVNWNDARNVAVFPGDNVYPDGLTDEGDPQYKATKYIMDYQLSLVKGKRAKAFFIPGNHDWKGGKPGGWERIMNQVNYINGLQQPNIQAWPLNGCPGPVPIEINEKVVMVIIDSQWFLHLNDKPGAESSCEARTIDEFTAQLREIIAQHQNQLMLVVMHHPMYTYGVHGGAYGLRQHIFPFTDAIKGFYVPLPVLGSVYPVARGLFGSIQDTYHPLYRTMIGEIEKVLKEHPNVVTAAGHEHSLQLIQKDSISHIVSGSASKLTRLRKGKNSLFSLLDYGFASLEIRKSGACEVTYYTLNSKDLGDPVFRKELKPITRMEPVASMDTLLPIFGDITIAPGSKMKSPGLGNMLWGKNYRTEWKQSISVPILDIGIEQGGLKAVKQEGALQTKTLLLTEKTGKQWSLRPIEKFPESVLPSDLRSTFSDIVIDNGVSGGFPYASLATAGMEKAAGIPVVRRKLVYVPDDPRLDRFRTSFKNSLAILEEREPLGVGKTFSTDAMVLALLNEKQSKVDQKAVLRARLLDNFIMDFDRHEGQWRWATKDSGVTKTYFPIPRESDQAFFSNEGLFSSLTRQPWFIPQIQGFRSKSINIKTFNKSARNFDRFFLTQLTEAEWSSSIDTFLARMTEQVIENSLQQQPLGIKGLKSSEIVSKLQKRKKYFKKEMLVYYRFISRLVTITGTNQREHFLVSKGDNGQVLVKITRLDSSGKALDNIYERIFLESVTKEIRLYALEGNDSITVDGQSSKIKIRIIGGPGEDYFVNSSLGKRIEVYDASFENNKLAGQVFKDRSSSDPEVNRYYRNGFKYDYIDPGTKINYNKDEGPTVKLSFEYFKQGFRREPYSMRQYVEYNKAFATGATRVVYNADFIKAIGKTDLNVYADIKGPGFVSNFFGIGNNTEVSKSNPKGIGYYRSHYNTGSFSVLAGKQLQSWLRVGAGPVFQYLNTSYSHNRTKILDQASIDGYDAGELFNNKSYLGAEARLSINSKNNLELPTRGAQITAYARQMFGLNSSSKTVSQLALDIRIFMSFIPQTKIVFATRFGAGLNAGHYEFTQAQYLGGTDNLRGFRRDRFAGRSMLFNNSEIRWKAIEFNTYIFKGSAGFLAFNDIGRVWSENERSGRWHNGYGGGIWVAPIARFVIVGSAAFSKEESLMPSITFGFQF